MKWHWRSVRTPFGGEEQHMWRPWGRKECSKFERLQRGWCGWSLEDKWKYQAGGWRREVLGPVGLVLRCWNLTLACQWGIPLNHPAVKYWAVVRMQWDIACSVNMYAVKHAVCNGVRAVNGFQRDLGGKINRTWPWNVGWVGWRSGEGRWGQKAWVKLPSGSSSLRLLEVSVSRPAGVSDEAV